MKTEGNLVTFNGFWDFFFTSYWKYHRPWRILLLGGGGWLIGSLLGWSVSGKISYPGLLVLPVMLILLSLGELWIAKILWRRVQEVSKQRREGLLSVRP